MLLRIVRADAVCRRFMTAPGIGAVVAVSYRTARFGPLTPSARSGILNAGDGTKNGLPASEQRTATLMEDRLPETQS